MTKHGGDYGTKEYFRNRNRSPNQQANRRDWNHEHRSVMRQIAEDHADKHPDHVRARKQAQAEGVEGKKCAVCGKPAAHAHHLSYDPPKYEWLCKEHHDAQHRTRPENREKAVQELTDLIKGGSPGRSEEESMAISREARKADRIPGGLADDKKPSDVDPRVLAAGVKVEMEHTNDREKAAEIALDHGKEVAEALGVSLTEGVRRYYADLAAMEARIEAEGERKKKEKVSKALLTAPGLRQRYGQKKPVDSRTIPNRRRTFAGMPIVVETPAGSLRKWDGGETLMRWDYGFIEGTTGAEGGGDGYDCYLGPDENAAFAYVIHQRLPEKWGDTESKYSADPQVYDEDKVMLGFPNAFAAQLAYLQHYDDPGFLGSMTQVPIEEFRERIGEMRDGMYKGEDSFSVPSSVRAEARRGLELRRKAGGKGGLSQQEAGEQGIGSGVQRAADLISGKVSRETVKRMHAFFSRHQENRHIEPGKAPHEDRGYVAWLLWGGDAGRSWAAKMVKQFDREVEKSGPPGYPGRPSSVRLVVPAAVNRPDHLGCQTPGHLGAPEHFSFSQAPAGAPGVEKARDESGHAEGGHETPPKEHRETGATERADYADPEGHRYPIHREQNVRAAISYFSMPRNYNKYEPGKRAQVWSRIKAAAKRFGIEVSPDSGPGGKKTEKGAVRFTVPL